MKLGASVSEAESTILEVLWRGGPATAEAVASSLVERGWQVSTIKTLLGRLLKKRAVRARPDGRRYIYSAVLTREQWVSVESEGLLGRLFGGRVAPLVAHFSKQRKLTKADVVELRRLIDELDHD